MRKLEELRREAEESVALADALSERLARCTAAVDDLVAETRATLRRAVEVLEREGLRGHRSGLYRRGDTGPSPPGPDEPDDETSDQP